MAPIVMPGAGAETTSSGEDTFQDKPRRGGYHHQHLPKHSDLKEKYKGLSATTEDKPTTLMIRNVPNRYKQQDLIDELEDLGFQGLFNFLYLPVDQGGRNRNRVSSVGYAFVNFIDHIAAEKCRAALEGFNFNRDGKVAHIQGLEANLAHYENAAVNAGKKGSHQGPVVMAHLAPSTVLDQGSNVYEPAKVEGSVVLQTCAPPGLDPVPLAFAPAVAAAMWEPAVIDVAATWCQQKIDAQGEPKVPVAITGARSVALAGGA